MSSISHTKALQESPLPASPYSVSTSSSWALLDVCGAPNSLSFISNNNDNNINNMNSHNNSNNNNSTRTSTTEHVASEWSILRNEYSCEVSECEISSTPTPIEYINNEERDISNNNNNNNNNSRKSTNQIEKEEIHNTLCTGKRNYILNCNGCVLCRAHPTRFTSRAAAFHWGNNYRLLWGHTNQFYSKPKSSSFCNNNNNNNNNNNLSLSFLMRGRFCLPHGGAETQLDSTFTLERSNNNYINIINNNNNNNNNNMTSFQNLLFHSIQTACSRKEIIPSESGDEVSMHTSSSFSNILINSPAASPTNSKSTQSSLCGNTNNNNNNNNKDNNINNNNNNNNINNKEVNVGRLLWPLFTVASIHSAVKNILMMHASYERVQQRKQKQQKRRRRRGVNNNNNNNNNNKSFNNVNNNINNNNNSFSSSSSSNNSEIDDNWALLRDWLATNVESLMSCTLLGIIVFVL